MKKHYKAKVFLQDKLAGNLLRFQNGKGFRFTYDKSYLDSGGTAISLSLPVSYLPVDCKILHAFFSELCSEGWMRGVQCHDQGIGRDDEFTVLTANGEDLAGAVTIFRMIDMTIKEFEFELTFELDCSGQLIPDLKLSFSSAAPSVNPPL